MSNILEILKLGLPGLVFLLAVISYRLLTKEQQKENPCPNVLKVIKLFLYINVVLVSLTIASSYLDKNTNFIDLRNWANGLHLKADIDSSAIQKGVAKVCRDAKYKETYLLVEDESTQKLIQIYAGNLMHCDQDKHYIALNKEDALNLGWDLQSSERIVRVFSAPQVFTVSK